LPVVPARQQALWPPVGLIRHHVAVGDDVGGGGDHGSAVTITLDSSVTVIGRGCFCWIRTRPAVSQPRLVTSTSPLKSVGTAPIGSAAVRKGMSTPLRVAPSVFTRRAMTRAGCLGIPC